MTTKVQEKLLAICKGADICIEDHGIPHLYTSFEFDDGSSVQGLGVYTLDAAFVFRFMNALGIEELSKASGVSVWLVHGPDRMISEIHPLHKKNGVPFIIADWREWAKKRGVLMSAHEMRTGENPRDTTRK